MYKIESEQDGGSGPKGPNFKLIVMLFAASIVIILAIAMLFLSDYGRHVRQSISRPHPTSQVVVRPDGIDV